MGMISVSSPSSAFEGDLRSGLLPLIVIEGLLGSCRPDNANRQLFSTTLASSQDGCLDSMLRMRWRAIMGWCECVR